ncbi:MAG: 16S rRNA (cytosine(1402)-N(4))-methyltransferase RsmH [Dehalococcoidales bacterium]
MTKSGPTSSHTPVLLTETLDALAVQPGGRYIDCTLGGAGHAAAIMEKASPGGQLLGIDADPEAIVRAREKLDAYRDAVLLVNDNFTNLQSICIKYDFFPVHGILLDLGLSSMQLDDSGRGFSFQHDDPLDMRFNPHQKITAASIVNTSPEERLANIIYAYGEESQSRKIAREIVKARPIDTTLHLAQLIENTIGRRGKIHPATRTFQALRIAVNQELEHLESVLKQAIELLGYEGRLVVISYHSLEDRIVKQFLHQEARGCICPPETPICVCGHTPRLRIVNKKVIMPSADEIAYNPRSRSAKLRAAERIITPGDTYASTDDHTYLILAQSGIWRKPVILEKIKTVFLAA